MKIINLKQNVFRQVIYKHKHNHKIVKIVKENKLNMIKRNYQNYLKDILLET